MENYTPETTAAETEQTAQASEPVQQPTEAPNAAQTFTPMDRVVGTGAFFGLEFLFTLPIIGFICTIIFSFAPKNQSLKHYARAKMIWAIIGLVLSVILILTAVIFFQALPDMISEELGIEVEDLEAVADIVEEFGGIGELSGIVSQIGDLGEMANAFGQISDPEAMEALLSELENVEDIEAIIGELENIEGIETIIGELESVENIDELAEQINDPEVIEALLEAYRNYAG